MSAFSNAQPIRRRSTLSSDSQKNLPSIPCDFSKNLAVVERKPTAIHRISAAILQFLNYNRQIIASGNVLSRSEEHTSELQSLMRISYAVFCLKNKKKITITINTA